MAISTPSRRQETGIEPAWAGAPPSGSHGIQAVNVLRRDSRDRSFLHVVPFWPPSPLDTGEEVGRGSATGDRRDTGGAAADALDENGDFNLTYLLAAKHVVAVNV